jgi:hypothetical protein
MTGLEAALQEEVDIAVRRRRDAIQAQGEHVTNWQSGSESRLLEKTTKLQKEEKVPRSGISR